MRIKSQKLEVRSWKLEVGYWKKFLLPIILFLLPIISQAQCAMCRAALQGEEATAKAEGINNGIVFLMVVPYVLVAAAGYAIYKIKYGKK